ncbi:MAG: hypothetical protein ACREQL_15370 [Candidatus Binatia bacterium]
MAVWLTWPLTLKATTDLPDPAGFPADILSAAWLLAWHTHALTTNPALILHPNAFHPAPFSLFYAPPALGPLPIFAPAYIASGSVPFAYAYAFLGGLALAGLGVAEVVRRWTGCPEAGFLAGLVLITSPTILGSPGTAPLCAMLAGLPWLVHGGAQRRLGSSASAGFVGALVLQGLVDPIFAMAAALIPLGAIACVRLARRATRRDGWRLTSRISLACAILSPLLLGYLAAWHGLDPGPGPSALATKLIESDAGTRVALLLMLQPTLQGLPVELTWRHLALVAGGALLAAQRRTLLAPGWRHAALWTAVGLGYSFLFVPLYLQLVLRHPELLDRLAPLRNLHRLTNDMLVSLPLLLGLAAAELFHRLNALGRLTSISRALVAAVITFVVLSDAAPQLPYRTVAAPSIPPKLQAVIASAGGPVLELPAVDPVDQAVAMYQSIGGWWPSLNGYASFSPPGFVRRMEEAARLPDPETLQRLVADAGLHTIVVTLLKVPRARRPPWLAWDALARAGLKRVAYSKGKVIFTVEARPRPLSTP